MAPVLKTIRSPPDYVEEYKQDYGYIGPALCAAVAKARTQPATLATASTTTALTTSQQGPMCTGKAIVQAGNIILVTVKLNEYIYFKYIYLFSFIFHCINKF